MADKDFKVKNGIDVAGNANIDGNLNAAKYQDSAPSSPVNGQIWIDSNATASVINTNDYLLKNDATAIYAPIISPIFTGTVVLPSTTSIGTVSATEIGYVNGVTSDIQTQLDAKAPLASPTFTGTVNAADITATGDIGSLGVVSGVTVSAAGRGLLVRQPSGDGSDAILQFTNNAITAQRASINANSSGDLTLNPSSGVIRNGYGRMNATVGGQGSTTSGSNLTVTHGLGVTPSSVVATARSNTYSATNNTNIFVGNIGSTTFTVFANNGASGAVSAAFAWIAVA